MVLPAGSGGNGRAVAGLRPGLASVGQYALAQDLAEQGGALLGLARLGGEAQGRIRVAVLLHPP